MIAALVPFVSAERRARMDDALVSRTRELVLVMEDISDEHNASAVLRSADAFGVLEVHVVERTTRFLLQAKTSIGAHQVDRSLPPQGRTRRVCGAHAPRLCGVGFERAR